MTDNEKAIEILKLYKQRLEESVSTELGNDIKAFETAIEALGETRWIPVSERLPESSGNYIVTVFDPVKKETFVTDAYYRCKEGDWGGEYFEEISGVIAWMPFPEPYKESEEE